MKQQRNTRQRQLVLDVIRTRLPETLAAEDVFA